MQYETMKYERKGRIGYITLSRPHALNAFNDLAEEELHLAFNEFDMDEEAWVGILHGEGRCFSAGADIKQQFSGPSREERNRRMGAGKSAEGYLGRTANWKPVIAAVHSYCLGTAMAKALECDLIVASEDAQFNIGETTRGLQGGTVWARLHHCMPSKIGVEMLLTGEHFPASELYRLGMINRLVPNGKHLEAAEELAQKLLKAPPLAVRAGVRVSRWPWMQKVAEAWMYALPLKLHLTEDFEESSKAWMEKRAPVYKAR